MNHEWKRGEDMDQLVVIKEVFVREGCEECKRGKRHSCPFAEEIREDGNPEYCTCCKSHEKECCEDI